MFAPSCRAQPGAPRGLHEVSHSFLKLHLKEISTKNGGCQPGCHSGKAIKTAIAGYNYIIVSLKTGMNWNLFESNWCFTFFVGE